MYSHVVSGAFKRKKKPENQIDIDLHVCVDFINGIH